MKKYIALIALANHLSAAIPLITDIRVNKNRVDITLNKEFKRAYLKEDFFVEYAPDINLEAFDYSVVTLPCIMNVISLVWISGKNYEIEEMDAEVYQSLNTIKDVFRLLYPNTSWEGNLIPKKIVRHTVTTTSSTSALLFSGGVDSTTSSLYHRDEKQLLITSWGQSGLPLKEAPLWEKVYRQIKKFARDYGHSTTYLKSNYYYFLNFPKLRNLSREITSWRIDTIEDIGWAGLIAPIMLSKGIKTLRIGSSETWYHSYASAANPYIDSNLSFMGLKFYHDLFSFCRFDKIKYLVHQYKNKRIKKPNLIICQTKDGSISCGSCEKCVLTLALLLGAGADPREFGYTFSPEKAARQVQQILAETEQFNSSNLWEYVNLQECLKETPRPLLSFFNTIDFSEKKSSDINETHGIIDWEEFDKRYPHVKKETT